MLEDRLEWGSSMNHHLAHFADRHLLIHRPVERVARLHHHTAGLFDLSFDVEILRDRDKGDTFRLLENRFPSFMLLLALGGRIDVGVHV